MRQLLTTDDAHRAQHTLKRILTILKVLVAQLDILETMTPLEFQSFRARLEAASGFQSDQFRQIEFVLGAKNERALRRFPEGTRGRIALDRYRHLKMVERTIGTMPGTGGSTGAECLRNTVGQNLFPDLWEIRARL